uniref:Uncharacterized protein n=1 Tax=Avena sativa TaxID=4498 RepID=A0ACD5XI94_AVESA
MSTDREKEREAELEGAMYTNCLLLGLDPAVLGSPAAAASPRVGLFRHSNPRLGEQLLYFLLSSLRGPVQSAKDFDKVWPIFDSAQSREFRKIVQGIISELEQQGALPRSNSRVSSLATCCGPRFVELLWQLSVHALREVHRRTFAADVASNPLPAALTDVSYLHAAALLPVTKATRLWESILARKGQHEVLASGPIEDLIAHREHRYRISGSQLLAAMETSSSVPHSEILSARAGESQILDKHEQISLFQGKEEALSRIDDRNGRAQQTVDVAEILRRWTHALQRIHKQSLHLAKANDGEGPELLRSASDGEAITHADSLTATLAEHRQHLVSIQGLINQLKEAIPAMQQSITDLSEEVNSAPNPVDQTNSRQLLSGQNAGFGRSEESSSEVPEMTSKLSSTHIDKAGSSHAQKLPPLFSLTPSSSGKGTQMQRRIPLARQPSQEILPEEKAPILPSTKDHGDGPMHENDGYFAHDIRRSVREAALSKPSSNTESPEDNSSDDGSEHFFIPLSTGASRKDVGAVANRRKPKIGLLSSQTKLHKSTSDIYYNSDSPMHKTPALSSKRNGHGDPSSAANFFDPVSDQSFMTDDALDQVFSPPLLLESSFFHDTYEDLLAPLSETDAALMEH